MTKAESYSIASGACLCWQDGQNDSLTSAVLVRAKRRVAAQLSSRALAADSKQTELCTWLSAILLGGLVLNTLAGWWWADPVAALVMVPIIANEGVEPQYRNSIPV